jgi:hypothetical protein
MILEIPRLALIPKDEARIAARPREYRCAMIKTKLAALAILLAACAPTAPDGPTNAPQPGDLIAGTGQDTLIEREPDLCHAADYQQYVGQPGTIVPSLFISRDYRVVPFGGIVSQEYNAGRLNFQLAPTGEIARVVCG